MTNPYIPAFDDDEDANIFRLRAMKGSEAVWRPREYLVEDLIPKRARPTSLFAPGGVGKGQFAIYIQTCIDHGIPILGRFRTHPVGWLGYVDAEDDQDEFSRRYIEICMGLGVEPNDHIEYVEVPDRVGDGQGKYELEAVLERWSKRGGHGLVVYDAAQALFGKNQNGEAGEEAYTQMMRWGKRFSHTPLVIDHTAYAMQGRGAQTHAQGSSQKTARVSSGLTLSQAEAVDRNTSRIDLYTTKSNSVVLDASRGAEPLARYTMKFYGGDDPPGPTLFIPDMAKEWDDVMKLGDAEVSVADASKVWRLSYAQAARVLNRAVDQGFMTKRKVGKFYVYRRAE